jgi:UDP-N-acetylmuramyl pentapeptide phosphotransferase/UDP-N-acetylglucosamine-1-phosphate transferase
MFFLLFFMSLFSCFLFLVSCILLVLAGLWLSKKMHLMDKPDMYADTKGTRKPVPTVQGLVLWLVVAIGITIFRPHLWMTHHGQAIMGGSFVLMLLGFLDDVAIGIRIPSLFRLGLQVVVAIGAVWRGDLAWNSMAR